jgi:hypothetical protein
MMRARARDQRLVADVARVSLLWHACIESFRYGEDSMGESLRASRSACTAGLLRLRKKSPPRVL